MILYNQPVAADPVPCPYVENREFIQNYFFAREVEAEEWDFIVSSGWRRFGLFFFRPACRGCELCRPLRIPCDQLVLSKSQKRCVKKNREVEVVFEPLTWSDELFDIYEKHSQVKFEEKSSVKQFKESFFSDALKGKALLSKYYYQKRLVAFGFLDPGKESLSSVYFCYDPDYSSLGLGTYSVIAECRWAHERGFRYYYLGYFIEECEKMKYKGKFKPFEIMNWQDGVWQKAEVPEPVFT